MPNETVAPSIQKPRYRIKRKKEAIITISLLDEIMADFDACVEGLVERRNEKMRVSVFRRLRKE